MGPLRTETIAAIATAPGHGGIGVVRVSGTGLLSFAGRLTGKSPVPRRAMLAHFLAAGGQPIDQGILLYFPAPRSFTGEDVLELQGHGGPVVLQMLLARCLELGARLAEPGEFSQRAFLNGKFDLVQAEAVADLIEAGSAAAARSALRSWSGEFSREVHGLVARLTELRMLLAGDVDLGIIWTGEAVLVQQENPAFEYIYPEEGAILWQDNWAIAAGAPHEDAAYAWLNYSMQPNLFWMMLRDFPYINPNDAALEYAKDNQKELYDAYMASSVTNVPPEASANGHFIVDVGDALPLFDRIWTEVKGQ